MRQVRWFTSLSLKYFSSSIQKRGRNDANLQGLTSCMKEWQIFITWQQKTRKIIED